MGLLQPHCGPADEGCRVIVSIADVAVNGLRVFVRVDFNVPLTPEGAVADDTRIVATLPTIKSITDRGGIAVLSSHLGRPKGNVVPSMSLRPVATRLAELINAQVLFAADCVGPKASSVISAAPAGSVVLLENLRFHQAEEVNDVAFAAELAHGCDLYCNDAFGAAHRAHASTDAAARLFRVRCAGLLVQNELAYLGVALTNPKRPFVAVLGGSKISGKIEVIESLLHKCDKILIGGGMMFTFLRARGQAVGNSLLEENLIATAKLLLGDTANDKILLPDDAVVADRVSQDAVTRVVSVTAIEEGWIGLDIGPNTAHIYSTIIGEAGTVFWNGPMGVFEVPPFDAGTYAIANAMVNATDKGCITIVGGGDSAAAISGMGLANRVSHVSTGGGASLEFLEGKALPGIAALEMLP